MRVSIDRTLCQDNGICVGAAPEVFALDDESRLVVLNDAPGDELSQSVSEAAMLCPVQAIIIE